MVLPAEVRSLRRPRRAVRLAYLVDRAVEIAPTSADPALAELVRDIAVELRRLARTVDMED